MSQLFSDEIRAALTAGVIACINRAQLPMASPRAIGDAVQELLSAQFGGLLGEHVAEYSESFARRAMADLAFVDRDGRYHAVDVKTHFEGGKFSMPT